MNPLVRLNLSEILPNPYRDFKLNPLQEKTIQDLMSSIKETGYWLNVQVRKRSDGRYEAVFGHHRIEAAMRAGIKEADFILHEYTSEEEAEAAAIRAAYYGDELFIKKFKNENMAATRKGILVVMESVQAVVKALAENKIRPFEHAVKTNLSLLRYAPSYGIGVSSAKSAEHAYTTIDIAEFLGYTREAGIDKPLKADKNIDTALKALYLMSIKRLELGELYKPVGNDPKGHELSVDAVAKLVKDRLERVEKEQAEQIKAAADHEASRVALEATQAIKNEEDQLWEEASKEEAKINAELKKAKEKKDKEHQEELKAEKERLSKKTAAEVYKLYAEGALENIKIYGATTGEKKRINEIISQGEEAVENEDLEATDKASENLSEAIKRIVTLKHTKEKEETQKKQEEKEVAQLLSSMKSFQGKLNLEGAMFANIEATIKGLVKNSHLTLRQRNTLFEAMRLVGDWYLIKAEMFLPPVKKEAK